MPMSNDFLNRLDPVVKKAAAHFGTPFHIYDEIGIRATGRNLNAAFSAIPGFREYYAVKALPNPRILRIMKELGFGFDCSSIAEIALSRQAGAVAADIMFTSNNTSREEFEYALKDGGAVINLDDITLLEKLPEMPELICFRYNPGPRRSGNHIIGNPVEAKYGLHHDQMIAAYRKARDRGAARFGLHTMLVSNELNYRYMIDTVTMILDLAESITAALGIRFDFVNIGGGFGIPYTPDQNPLDISALGRETAACFDAFGRKNGYAPALYVESGRYMTGPHGVLVTTVINEKNTYRRYIGVDACMSALMRPAIYGAYHEISIHGKNGAPAKEPVDVVGALCENNDKFAIQRCLPKISPGDLLLIHDTGAHGHAMGFNYNGRLRPKELLLRADGNIELIRREETLADHFATLDFKPDVMPS
ncbi:MAG: diaminopimelate decarboxylase [Thermodesulfobacteriota bacterium]